MMIAANRINKILIVDDSALARGMGKKLLAGLFPDAEFHEGKDVESGFHIWNEVRPDLAFLDLNMPGGNGFDLADRIRRVDRTANLVLCTANVQDATRDRATGMGLGFLNKPITAEKVEQLVERKGA